MNRKFYIYCIKKYQMKTLVTGGSLFGFIGMHTCEALLKEKKKIVVGIDNINNYYDIKLKKKRLNELKKYKNFIFYKIDLKDAKKINHLFKKHRFKYVINLAAQAGSKVFNFRSTKLCR